MVEDCQKIYSSNTYLIFRKYLFYSCIIRIIQKGEQNDMEENKDFELLWYLNLTLTQVIDLLDTNLEESKKLAISFLKLAKKQIKDAHPEVLQYDER